MTYIRKQKKEFGKNSQIEGIINKNDQVLLVEDLMTDGGSKLRFFEAIEEVGAKIQGVFVIFNYGIINKNYIFKKKIDITYLTNWKFVLEVAHKRKILSNEEIKIIENFLLKINVKN